MCIVKFIVAYVRMQLDSHRQFIFMTWVRILQSSPSRISCILQNIYQNIRRREARFHYDKQMDLFFVQSLDLRHFFYRHSGFEFYGLGLQHRADMLAKSYFIDKIPINNDDVIIDCGAYFADLYRYFMFQERTFVHYISFEPHPQAYQCVSRNAVGGLNNNVALSDRIGVFGFYLSGPDSSLIEPKKRSQ